MLILPTKGRPLSLKRFVYRWYETAATIPVYVVLDQADADTYENVGLPSGWKTICAPVGVKLGPIFNLIFEMFPDEPFYAMVADDCVPESREWDVMLRNACLPDKIAWGNDGFQGELLPTFPFIGGDLLRKLGWWAPPGIKHSYIDNAWKLIADKLSVAAYQPDVLMTHCHHANGGREMDATDVEQPNASVDKVMFESFQRFELPGILERFAP